MILTNNAIDFIKEVNDSWIITILVVKHFALTIDLVVEDLRAVLVQDVDRKGKDVLDRKWDHKDLLDHAGRKVVLDQGVLKGHKEQEEQPGRKGLEEFRA